LKRKEWGDLEIDVVFIVINNGKEKMEGLMGTYYG
jgi:hypothetical protein